MVSEFLHDARMTVFTSAMQRAFRGSAAEFQPASARSKVSTFLLWADCVEKLFGFSLSKWVIALILFERLYVDHDVSLWRAPSA